MNVLVQMMDHPFGHRLGWALCHSIWEGALGAAVFAVVRFWLRRRSANVRYLAATTMLVALAGAPIITLLRLPATPVEPWRTGNSADRVLRNESSLWRSSPTDPAPAVTTWTPQYLRRGTELLDQSLGWIVPLWAIGVIAFLCRWLYGSQWIRHVRTIDIEPLDPEWLARLHDLCARLNITRPVRLLKSALIEVPMVVGWLRPVILLPVSALAGLTPEQLESILAHELAHVRRYDHLVNTFQNLMETLMFYHPAVWWVSRCIREEREHCCDDLVVRVCGDRLTYVRALVTLEETRVFPRLAFAASGGSLLRRVRRLLGVSLQDRPPSAVEFGGITLVAIGCVLILAAIWLLNRPAVYRAAALIRVNPALPVQTTALNAGASASAFYPYFLETECLVIRSAAVLERVFPALQRDSAEKPDNAEAVRVLKTRLTLRPVPNTSAIEIQASGPDPVEAAHIANAAAASYQEYRLEQRRKYFHDSLDSLEARFSEYEQKVRKAQEHLDRLRVELGVPDAVVSENMPTVLLSAESLRHIEALRIESQADYVRQRTLLDRLEKLDPEDRAATISSMGIQDNQLNECLQALAIVEQKVISFRHEDKARPENVEFNKTIAQQADLSEKITARTSGILRGLQAKLESTGEGLASLSNAVANAQDSDKEAATRSRPYFEAKRDLEELIRFRQILQTKIAMERTDLQLPVTAVEVVEAAMAPSQAMAPNRPRAVGLLGAGLLLTLLGCLLGRAGRAEVGNAVAA